MARTVLPVQVTGRTGTRTITYVNGDSTNDHYFDNSTEKVSLLVKNGTVSEITVTIATPVTIDGLALPDLAVTIAAGADAIIGPFPKGTYNQTYNDGVDDHLNSVLVDVSATDADIDLAALKLA